MAVGVKFVARAFVRYHMRGCLQLQLIQTRGSHFLLPHFLGRSVAVHNITVHNRENGGSLKGPYQWRECGEGHGRPARDARPPVAPLSARHN